MLSTPSTSHVCFDNVYEPAEDSFLFLDCVSSEVEKEFLKDRLIASTSNTEADPCPVVLEVGTGSGVLLAFVTANAKAIFGRADILTLGIDINDFACRATQKTVDAAVDDMEQCPVSEDIPYNPFGSDPTSSNFLGCIVADLCTPLKMGMIDVLLFNPPYVPTAEIPPLPEDIFSHIGEGKAGKFEEDSQLLALSYAGGLNGMETTNRLLERIPEILDRRRGVAYILLCDQNQPESVKSKVRAWGPSWQADTVASSGRKGGWEKLQIIRIWRVMKPA